MSEYSMSDKLLISALISLAGVIVVIFAEIAGFIKGSFMNVFPLFLIYVISFVSFLYIDR